MSLKSALRYAFRRMRRTKTENIQKKKEQWTLIIVYWCADCVYECVLLHGIG